jgi:hypothetical protein
MRSLSRFYVRNQVKNQGKIEEFGGGFGVKSGRKYRVFCGF